MLTIKDIKGIIPPIITPVDQNENVDTEGLKRVVNHVVTGGVHGVFVLGSNGEFYGLDRANQLKAIETTVNEVKGKVPVYAGATAITTKEVIYLAKAAEAAGADALSILTPMFIQPNEMEMYKHFESVAKATQLPILLYNNPGKTTNNISVDLLKKLAEIDNIVGIKNTSLDFSQTVKYIDATKDNDHFTVLSGSDYYIYATLAYGGSGAIAGTANVAPKLVSAIYDKYVAGDLKGAMEAQMKLVSLRNTYSYGSFPVVMKDCMNLLGLEVGDPIAPIGHCSPEKMEALKKVLANLDLI